MKINGKRPRALATLQTYDPHECTSAGYDLTLYADGSVSAERYTCYSGDTVGRRWRSAPGLVRVADLIDDDQDHDAEAALTDIARRIVDDASWLDDWRMTRRGSVVR